MDQKNLIEALEEAMGLLGESLESLYHIQLVCRAAGKEVDLKEANLNLLTGYEALCDLIQKERKELENGHSN